MAPEISFSLLVLAILLIPGVLLAVAVAADTKGSPIYVHERVGYRGRSIGVLKFRTMVADADNVEKYLDDRQLKQWMAERKVDNDPRVTGMGLFLRRSSLDELPQFLNVLAGQMSVVGPRPVTKEEIPWFSDSADELLSCRPGITGLWQTLDRNDASYETGARQAMELSYVRRRCIRMDARILVRTVSVMARGTGR